MGRKIALVKLLYIPSLESIDRVRAACGAQGRAGEPLLLGEYGPYSPLAVAGRIREFHGGPLFLELIAKNKNRDLVRSSLVSAPLSGFDGVVLASGRFLKGPGMAKPVYDLDPSQMLILAARMRNEGTLPETFTIAVRAPSGDGAASARARFFLENGADYLAFSAPPADEFKDRGLTIEELPGIP